MKTELKREALELYNKGMYCADICKLLAIPKGTMSGWVKASLGVDEQIRIKPNTLTSEVAKTLNDLSQIIRKQNAKGPAPKKPREPKIKTETVKVKRHRDDVHNLLSFKNVRRTIFMERGRKCEECGWDKPNPFTGIIPVQIDHIDGNRENNHRENLKVLCPNCHAMTKNFMFYGRSHKGTYGTKGTVRRRN